MASSRTARLERILDREVREGDIHPPKFKGSAQKLEECLEFDKGDITLLYKVFTSKMYSDVEKKKGAKAPIFDYVRESIRLYEGARQISFSGPLEADKENVRREIIATMFLRYSKTKAEVDGILRSGSDIVDAAKEIYRDLRNKIVFQKRDCARQLDYLHQRYILGNIKATSAGALPSGYSSGALPANAIRPILK